MTSYAGTYGKGAIRVCAWVSSPLANAVRQLLQQIRVPVLTTAGHSQATGGETSIVVCESTSEGDLYAARASGINRLVLDPGVLDITICSRSDPSLRALAPWKGANVALVCGQDATQMRRIHLLASVIPSELIVLGLDSTEAIAHALRVNEPDDPLPVVVLRSAMSDWPESLRLALSAALEQPSAWPVKRLAAMSGLSARTIERCFSTAGLPGPATMLRQIAHRPH